MKVYRGFSDKTLKKKKRCLAIGIFDGAHRAHARILRGVVREAKRTRARSAVLTFDPHPQKVLSGDHKNPLILMSLAHRLRVIASFGVAEAVVVPFNKKFSRVDRDTFLEKYLIDRLGVKMLAVGHDFRFGRGARGTTRYLAACSRRLGFKLFVCPPVKQKGRVISSTAIRRLIERGHLKQAEKMLGRPVSVYGTVVRGRGRGRTLGFPTANLDPHHETLPPEGVYAVRGELDGKHLKGVMHIGKRPTFGERDKRVEAHLFDWKRPLYGRELEFFFVRKLRPTRHFKGPAELIRAIRSDERRARRIFALQG